MEGREGAQSYVHQEKLSQSHWNAGLLFQGPMSVWASPMAQGLRADRFQHTDHMGQITSPVEQLGRKHKDR